jgi:hypothetical protein
MLESSSVTNSIDVVFQIFLHARIDNEIDVLNVESAEQI